MFDTTDHATAASELGRLVAVPDDEASPVDLSRLEELGVSGAVDVVRAARRLASFAEAVSLAATAALERAAADAAGDGGGRRVVLHEPTGTFGVHSTAAVELSLATSVSPREAEARLAAAARVVEVLPRTWAALAHGEIGVGHARCLVEGTRGLDAASAAAVESRVLPAAGGRTVRQVAAAVVRARSEIQARLGGRGDRGPGLRPV